MFLQVPSILEWKHSSPCLTPLQSQVDGLVGGFVEQATDGRSLVAMTTGGLAYRLGRVGVMSTGLGSAARVLSVGVGLGAEVTAFEMTNRSLSSLTGEAYSHPNLWRWEGQGGIRQGLLSSLITFGSLKGAGRLAQGENFVVQHLLQDTGMVLGHQVSGSLGITPRPTGSLAEQFLHAEATNLQLGAGMALGHGLIPGILGLERGLELSLRSQPTYENPPFGQSVEYIDEAGERSLFSFQPAIIGGTGKTEPNPFLPNVLMMSSGKEQLDRENQSEPPVVSNMRPKRLTQEEAASGTFSYPPEGVSIREMEAKYQMVVESATDGILSVGEDGLILFLNPAVQKIFGYKPAELLGKPLTLLMPPEMALHHERAFHRYIATGERSIPWDSVPLIGLHKDGREIPLEISFGEFIQSGQRTFTAVMRDISERRKAEKALREITERNEALLRVMPYKFCRVHRDGTILDVRSNQSGDLLESPERLIGANIHDLPLSPDLKEITTITIPRALETGEMQVVEYLFPHPDGRNLFQRARILKSGPDEVVWITEDTTETKREEAIRLEREQHETLLLVGKGLAHDINNALASGIPSFDFIRESLQTLLQIPPLANAKDAGEIFQQIFEDLDVLEASVHRIGGMTREFGDLTAVPKPRLSIDLHSLLHKRALRASLGPGIRLQLDTEPAPFRVWGHRDDLARVIENLIKNAREAMQGRPDPTLAVQTRGIELNTESLARLLPLNEERVVPGHFMRLRIQDTGEGMDEKTLSQIFRPYFSTKEPSQSTPRGIGLTISLKLIRDLGGFMVVKSKLGEGSVFDLYLPEAVLINGTRSPRKAGYVPPTLPPLSLLSNDPSPPEGGEAEEK